MLPSLSPPILSHVVECVVLVGHWDNVHDDKIFSLWF